MSIWETCEGAQQIGNIEGILYRIVESQEQIATLGYVDTLEEQAILEELLDSSKPKLSENTNGYHYLLNTPFRYPPLKWGSRFGKKHEPAIFYGAKSIPTTLAESAFYRFVFWYSMDGEPPKSKIRSEHTLFSAGYATNYGMKLYSGPFKAFQAELMKPNDYHQCQLLGSAMRDAGVQAFEYLSARDNEKGICVGLFSPAPFTHKAPLEMVSWLSEVSKDEVLFKQFGSPKVFQFPLEQFLLDGKFYFPAG